MQPLYFGGSFNPPHHGHLICARAVAEKSGFEQVIFLPTGQPPHKPLLSDLAAAEDRLGMCIAATAHSTLFQVSDIELKRHGPSYSIDTVRELAKGGQETINWLIGADMLLYLPFWHRAEDLLREVHFVIIARPGWTLDWQKLPPPFRDLQHDVVEAPLIEISASDIRRRVAAGLPIDYLCPPPVCEYIRRHRLYC